MAGVRASEQELKDLLVTQLEVLDEAEFGKVRELADRFKIPFEQALVERGGVPMHFLLESLGKAWGVGFKELRASDVRPDALRLVPEEFARSRTLLPFAVRDGQLHVAMWDPRDQPAIDELQRMAWMRVVPHLATETAIQRALLLYKGDLHAILERAVTERAAVVSGDGDDQGRSAITLLDSILEYAVVSEASDVHIEPYELEAYVRYRIDGALHDVLSLPSSVMPSLLARIKILSEMRIDEKRVPQDGRFDATFGGLKLDFRVATMPTHWGEKAVIRLLTKERALLDLEDLGFLPADREIVTRGISRPFGLILITGPTGSGKTTTLYATLTRLFIERHNVVNISTVEDPVEYTIPRVNQISINPVAGMTFASGLRALLRQDPDIIMVGEIRDRETVEMAIRAALVGRLVLSTLHTNDATSAVPRLLDLGIEPFLINSTLALVMAQRLVRKICLHCRQSVPLERDTLERLRARADYEETIRILQAEGVLGHSADPLSGLHVFKGKGCPQCLGSGYRGRMGVFELFEVTDTIRTMILERRDASAIRKVAIAGGMRTMFWDGLAKSIMGETTIEEVFRVAL
ncbi:MAG TPA: GspE/PulE family protein [bacterium]|nr:GspE/PulE family protein [bacterium]